MRCCLLLFAGLVLLPCAVGAEHPAGTVEELGSLPPGPFKGRGHVLDLAFSADGAVVAAVFESDRLKIWEYPSGELLLDEQPQEGVTEVARFGSAGFATVSSDRSRITVWQPGPGGYRRGRTVACPSRIYGIAWAADSSRLIICEEGAFFSLGPGADRPRSLVRMGADSDVPWALDSAGRRLIFVRYPKIISFGLEEGAFAKFGEIYDPDPGAFPLAVAVDKVAIADLGMSVRGADGAEVYFDDSGREPVGVAIHPHGTHCAGLLPYGGIRVWDLVRGTFPMRIPCEHVSSGCFGFSPSGELLAIGTRGGIQFWDTDGWTPVAMHGHYGPVVRLALREDGSLLSQGHSGRVVLWRRHPDDAWREERVFPGRETGCRATIHGTGVMVRNMRKRTVSLYRRPEEAPETFPVEGNIARFTTDTRMRFLWSRPSGDAPQTILDLETDEARPLPEEGVVVTTLEDDGQGDLVFGLYRKEDKAVVLRFDRGEKNSPLEIADFLDKDRIEKLCWRTSEGADLQLVRTRLNLRLYRRKEGGAWRLVLRDHATGRNKPFVYCGIGPLGRCVYSLSADGEVRIWSLVGERALSRTVLELPPGTVRSLDVNWSRKTAYLGGEDGGIKIVAFDVRGEDP